MDRKAEIETADLEALAREILGECRVSLMMAFRFLDAALWKMPYRVSPTQRPLCTDGRAVYFDPVWTIVRFRDDSDELVRDMLHLILHCVFGHPFEQGRGDGYAWWLACDIAVESICIEIAGKRFASVLDPKRREELAALKASVGEINHLRLYYAIAASRRDLETRERLGLFEPKLRELEELFCRDVHERWATTDSEDDEDAEVESTRPDEHAMADMEETGGSTGQSSVEELAASEEEPPEDPGSRAETAEDTEDDPQVRWMESAEDETGQGWEEIGKQVEMDLESFSREWGEQAGNLVSNLRISNRQSVDYADFLRRFASPREEIRVNDDEFDYIFYTFGLERYGNMPLVEPLEYMETQSVREFVVAIDTSESCSGELIRAFVERTFEILRDTGSFATEVNVHLIQCDAEVQSDVKITSRADLDRLMESFEVRGFGGTDFRPVFEYVQGLIDSGEFENLSGLIYFTDGFGAFPEKMPGYDTAFVFLDDGLGSRRVPPWAMKVMLDAEKAL